MWGPSLTSRRSDTNAHAHTCTALISPAQWLVLAGPRQKNTALLWRSLRPTSLPCKRCTTLQNRTQGAHWPAWSKQSVHTGRFLFIILPVTDKIWDWTTNLAHKWRINGLAGTCSEWSHFMLLSEAIKNPLGQKWWPRIALPMSFILGRVVTTICMISQSTTNKQPSLGELINSERFARKQEWNKVHHGKSLVTLKGLLVPSVWLMSATCYTLHVTAPTNSSAKGNHTSMNSYSVQRLTSHSKVVLFSPCSSTSFPDGCGSFSTGVLALWSLWWMTFPRPFRQK